MILDALKEFIAVFASDDVLREKGNWTGGKTVSVREPALAAS
jgi:hypothetical protein